MGHEIRDDISRPPNHSCGDDTDDEADKLHRSTDQRHTLMVSSPSNLSHQCCAPTPTQCTNGAVDSSHLIEIHVLVSGTVINASQANLFGGSDVHRVPRKGGLQTCLASWMPLWRHSTEINITLHDKGSAISHQHDISNNPCPPRPAPASVYGVPIPTLARPARGERPAVLFRAERMPTTRKYAKRGQSYD